MDEKLLLEIVANYTSYDAESITEEMNFADELGIDSLDLVDIISEIEDKFKIEISDDDLMKGIDTVGDAMNLLRAKYED